MSGYESAPATLMLAQQCAICSRPLVDAKSVELGIGPDCRRKHGYDQDIPEEAREEANRIVYSVALARSQRDTADLGEIISAAVSRLQELGLVQLASVLAGRAAVVRITEAPGGRLAVRTPYSQDVVFAMRGVPGRRWEAADKVNTFPETSRTALWSLLRAHFPGAVAQGPKGLFVIA